MEVENMSRKYGKYVERYEHVLLCFFPFSHVVSTPHMDCWSSQLLFHLQNINAYEYFPFTWIAGIPHYYLLQNMAFLIHFNIF